jgi:hypothetical protein
VKEKCIAKVRREKRKLSRRENGRKVLSPFWTTEKRAALFSNVESEDHGGGLFKPFKNS